MAKYKVVKRHQVQILNYISLVDMLDLIKAGDIVQNRNKTIKEGIVTAIGKLHCLVDDDNGVERPLRYSNIYKYNGLIVLENRQNPCKTVPVLV